MSGQSPAQTSTDTWRFHPMDTLFFRESRPHSPVGASILSSVFPPSARTVAGAVRYLIGEGLGVDWLRLQRSPTAGSAEERFVEQVGIGDAYGALKITGPWLTIRREERWERLYPAPRILAVRKTQGEGEEGEKVELQAFTLGERVECDLGLMRLPRLPTKPVRGWKGVEDGWLTETGWSCMLRGHAPAAGTWIHPEQLVKEEPRLGIVRDARRGSAVKGLLYQTRHLRLPAALMAAEEVAVEVRIEGLDASCGAPVQRVVRLGGEGRMTTVEAVAVEPFLKAPDPGEKATGVILNLLTPAALTPGTARAATPEGGWLLPRRGREAAAWRGTMGGYDLTVHSAILGKPLREGGWDLARQAPRPVRGLVPSGSAWYCTVDKDGVPLRGAALAEAIQALHGHRIGDETAIGRGCLAVGLWHDDQDFNTTEDAS